MKRHQQPSSGSGQKHGVSRDRRTRRYPAPWVVFSVLILLLIVASVVECSLGPMNIPFADVWKGSLLYFQGNRSADSVVLGAIRLPRLVVAILVGAGLASSGAALQAIFRNPMADPGIIGVSSGGSLGAVIVIGTGLASRGVWWTPGGAFVLGVLAMFTVYRLGTIGGRTTIHSLLLSGVAVGALCNAMVTFILSLQPSETMQQMLFWLMGGLDGSSWTTSLVLFLVVIVTFVLFLSQAHALDILSVGEDQAEGVGVHLQRVKQVVLVASALLVGVSVSFTGVIGFVGLIVPHLIRLWAGPVHRQLIPAAALGGSVLVVVADTLARMLFSPVELNIGVVTSIIGAPFFLYLLRRQYRVMRKGR